MSERVEKTILEECEHLTRLVKAGEVMVIPHYYYIDDNTGEKVYDLELMREEFELEMEDLESCPHISNEEPFFPPRNK